MFRGEVKSLLAYGESPMSTAKKNEETIVEPNEAALVVEEDGEFRLILPDYADDEDVPFPVSLLVAISLKLDDENWIAATMAALDD